MLRTELACAQNVDASSVQMDWSLTDPISLAQCYADDSHLCWAARIEHRQCTRCPAKGKQALIYKMQLKSVCVRCAVCIGGWLNYTSSAQFQGF